MNEKDYLCKLYREMGFLKFTFEFGGYSPSSIRNTFRQVTTSPALTPTSELTTSLPSKSFLKHC